jgi:anti-anti-sigma factor
MNPRHPFVGLPRRNDAQLRVDVHRHTRVGFALSVEGQLERATAPVLAGCLHRLLAVARSPESVVVNLARVTFIDGGGLKVLLDAARCAVERGCSLRLTHCSRSAVRLFRTTTTFDGAVELQERPVVRPSDGPTRAGFPLVSV